MHHLGYPVKSFLASTGRSDGGRDCRKLQMTQDPRDYRLVGDGGNDPERATSAEGTGGHIQIKAGAPWGADGAQAPPAAKRKPSPAGARGRQQRRGGRGARSQAGRRAQGAEAEARGGARARRPYAQRL